MAVDANVKSLILWHISRRYRERDVLNEAREIFPNAIVARDYDHFAIKRGIGAQKVVEQQKSEDEQAGDE